MRITKIKGHTKWSAVKTGKVAVEDKLGNDAADALARIGAAQHNIDNEGLRRAQNCRNLSRTVQSMMVEIAAARNRQAVTHEGSDSQVVARDVPHELDDALE
eukprot:7325610-Karenia_brevis.AAC.1